MKTLIKLAFLSLFAVGLAGCTQFGTQERTDPNAMVVDYVKLVKDTGRAKAVLHLHKRRAFPDACSFGISLTNNLREEIHDISFRFSAYIRDGVFHSYETKSFFGLKPSEDKYREMTFQHISCDEIVRLELTDPGRCEIGKTMTRYTMGPGDCARLVDVVPTDLVNLVRK